MKNRMSRLEWIGAAIMFLLSFPLHFLYDFIGGEPSRLGFLVPVSESVWEHLKLLFYPAIIVGTVLYFIKGKELENYIPAKVIGIFAGMLGIVISFYTYTGVIGENYLIADILTYVIGAVAMVLTTLRVIKSGAFESVTAKRIAILALVLMGILFAVYTYNPPMLNIFTDETRSVFSNWF